jgi:hypothetical protein
MQISESKTTDVEVDDWGVAARTYWLAVVAFSAPRGKSGQLGVWSVVRFGMDFIPIVARVSLSVPPNLANTAQADNSDVKGFVDYKGGGWRT